MTWLVVFLPLSAFPIVVLLILLTMDLLQGKSGSGTSPERPARFVTFSSKAAH